MKKKIIAVTASVIILVSIAGVFIYNSFAPYRPAMCSLPSEENVSKLNDDEYDFRSIPFNKKLGLDGHGIIIEGVNHSDYNFVDTWCPEPESPEYKIYCAIYDCYREWEKIK